MKKIYWLVAGIVVLASCKKNGLPETSSTEQNRNAPAVTSERQESTSFSQIGIIDIGNTGAAEISAYDPDTKKLFVVNSVYVSNGKVAAAIEATIKTSPGKVVVFNTTTHAEIAVRTVGSLPDMVC